MKQIKDRFTPRQAHAAWKRYIVDGLNIIEVASEFKIAPNSVYKLFGIIGKKPLSQPESMRRVHALFMGKKLDRMVKMYYSGISGIELAERYDVTPQTIYNSLRRAGADIRERGGWNWKK